MIKCNRCGKCCEVIALNQSWQDICRVARDKNAPKTLDQKFVYRNWIPVSKEKALKINPYLKHWEFIDRYFFYTCKMFDPVSRTCIVHSIRPKVCSGFPMYEGIYNIYENEYMNNKLKRQPLYSKDCAYHAKIDFLKLSEMPIGILKFL